MAGVVPGDIAQMAFGYGMFTGGFGLHYGLQRLGCAMIPAGSGNTERHIQMIEDLSLIHISGAPIARSGAFWAAPTTCSSSAA